MIVSEEALHYHSIEDVCGEFHDVIFDFLLAYLMALVELIIAFVADLHYFGYVFFDKAEVEDF